MMQNQTFYVLRTMRVIKTDNHSEFNIFEYKSLNILWKRYIVQLRK